VNLPNAITLSRLVMTVVFVAAASTETAGGHALALAMFCLAAASDWLDGFLARRLGLVTPLGKLLDPLADKILVCTGFVFLSVLHLCPLWASALIIAREFLVTGLRQIAVEAGQVLAADQLGKWKTGFQLAFCIAALVWLAFEPHAGQPTLGGLLHAWAAPHGWLLPTILWTAVGLTAVSGANYLWNSRNLLRGRTEG
jgi:CDP-diacylglycerol--glycerol-3-phosphate 3-phosphatidyltransferase